MKFMINLCRFLAFVSCVLSIALLAIPIHAQDGSELEHSDKTTWYTCGMHPEVIEDHPGTCPKCGMKLIPMSDDRAEALGLVKAQGQKEQSSPRVKYWRSPMVSGEVYESPGKDSMGHELVPVYEETSSAGAIKISPVVTQNMGIRTAKVKRGNVVRTVRTVGIVDYNETSLAVVSTKVGGWIEKLFVDKTGSQVHKGDKLFDIYSPELYSAQGEFLSALNSADQSESRLGRPGSIDGMKGLIEEAKVKLQYFDVSDEQISELQKTRKLEKTITINAPATGIVTHKKIIKGQMIKPGEALFQIADLSSVWVIAKVFESDVPYLKVGQSALMTLSYIPGKTFRGYITYIYPYLAEKSREVSIRMEFHNPGYELKPGMFAEVQIESETEKDALLVPDVAVIDTGLRTVAFTTSEPGHFELRNVVVGPRSNDNYVQVLSGLSEGESVVTSGQFLLDSESRLREAASKFLMPKVGVAVHDTSHVENSAVTNTPEKQFFACPMPDHVDTLYQSPGPCPLCGMDLVPVPNPNGTVIPDGKEGPHVH